MPHSQEPLEFTSGADPATPPVASVVVLHGLGADGSDFVPIVRALDLKALGAVRFVLPNAPLRPVTLNGGYEMPAWYDIYPPNAQGERPEDEAGLRQSQAQVQRLLDREVARGVPAHRQVLMGFSQGCAMALLTGLRAPQRLAGIVAWSGYLPLANTTAFERSSANQSTPICMAHGEHDDVVALERGLASCQRLRSLGYPVEWRTYPMAHSVCPSQVADLNAWLLRVLKPQ